MNSTHPSGYLAYGALNHQLQRVRACPRCGGDERLRRYNEVCAACKATPEYQIEQQARKRRYNRNNRAHHRAGTVAAPGRPRIQPDDGLYEFGGAQ